MYGCCTCTNVCASCTHKACRGQEEGVIFCSCCLGAVNWIWVPSKSNKNSVSKPMADFEYGGAVSQEIPDTLSLSKSGKWILLRAPRNMYVSVDTLNVSPVRPISGFRHPESWDVFLLLKILVLWWFLSVVIGNWFVSTYTRNRVHVLFSSYSLLQTYLVFSPEEWRDSALFHWLTWAPESHSLQLCTSVSFMLCRDAHRAVLFGETFSWSCSQHPSDGVDSLMRLLEWTAALLLAHLLGPGWFCVGSLLVMRLGENGEIFPWSILL